MQFEIKEEKFMLNGEEVPLICGEIHYFRIPKAYWSEVLDKLVESGCNAVAYYVPWFVHEYEEGKFDFTGEIHEDNDLHTWIKLTMERNLLAFFRPGPYVYAETTDLGIPKWFTNKYKNAHVKSYKDGKYVESDFVRGSARNHPEFIASTQRWYERVCREIKNYLAPNGNIVMFQLCNEIPGDDTDDRTKENMGIGKKDGIFPSYLKKKYKTIDNLNKSYNANFSTLENVEQHMLEEKNTALAENDHLEFYYGTYFPTYFKTLKEIAERNGIHVQFVHNAYNPRAVSLHYHNKKENPWLNIGVDCYYALSGRIGIKEATYYCDFGAEYTKRFLNNIPWVIEQQSGYWNDYPVVYGPELYIWNIWTMACGYKGFNMYLFAGGINRRGMGFYGTDHNWQAPIDCYGEEQGSFLDIKRSISDIKENLDTFFTENRYDIALGVKNAYGLIWRKVAKPSNEAFFTLKSYGFTPSICDFENSSLEELLKHKVLFVVSDMYMESDVQEKLYEYANQGGTLILNGTVPYKDYMETACTVLADKLGIQVSPHDGTAEHHQQKFILNETEYFIGKAVQKIKAAPEHIVSKTSEDDRAAALTFDIGKGKILILPFMLEVLFHSMTVGIGEILSLVGATPYIKSAKMLRVIPKMNGKNVLLNLHPVQVNEEIEIGGEIYNLTLEAHSFKVI